MATDIYILAGQSNMVGVAPLAGEPAPVNPTRLMMYSNAAQWVPAVDPIDSNVGQIDSVSSDNGAAVGPGLWFADRMATLQPDNTIGVIPCAKSASYLVDWNPDYTRLKLYGSMMARAREASVYGRIRGLVWYQGEAEALNPIANIQSYSYRMHELFQNIRVDLGIANLPIVFVQIGPNPNDATNYPYWATVQSWQQAISDANVPGIAMVTAKDLHVITGNIYHLDQPSQITLGGRIADKMFSILPADPTPPPPTPRKLIDISAGTPTIGICDDGTAWSFDGTTWTQLPALPT